MKPKGIDYLEEQLAKGSEDNLRGQLQESCQINTQRAKVQQYCDNSGETKIEDNSPRISPSSALFFHIIYCPSQLCNAIALWAVMIAWLLPQKSLYVHNKICVALAIATTAVKDREAASRPVPCSKSCYKAVSFIKIVTKSYLLLQNLP